MKNLTIKNIGAIKEASMELKKVNMIMGPQSSGKSTICKITSFCMWMEKKCCLSHTIDPFLSSSFFNERLIEFHKLIGYTSEESYIQYETDTLVLTYDFKEAPRITWKNRCGYHRSKIAYIPGERNIVSVINNWFEVRFKNTNILNFMIDWDDSRKNYRKENPLNVINLNMKYYFDDTTGRDIVTVNDAKSSDLTNTSSGLQSLIPLLVLTHYLITHLKEIDKQSSVVDEQSKSKVIQKIYEEYFELKNLDFPSEGGTKSIIIDTGEKDPVVEIEDNKIIVKTDAKEIRLFESQEKKKIFESVINHTFKTQSINLYIEEPELNLFPLAQRDLLYELVKLISTRENDCLTLTTHSPYILYALNNCMMGYLVKDRIPDDTRNEIDCHNSWINPEQVSVWEIKDGYLKGLNGELNTTIQQEDGLIGDNYFDCNMKEVMDDFYKMLNYYGDDNNED